MGIYDGNASDAAKKTAIVEFLTNTATEAGSEAIHAAPRVKGPQTISNIKAALGDYSSVVDRLVNELVDDSTIVRDMVNSPNEQAWQYTVA